MRKLLLSCVTIALLCQCGAETQTDGRKTSTKSSDAIASTVLRFFLPSRADLQAELSSVRSEMNGYQLELWSTAGCPTPVAIQETAPFVDYTWVTVNVNQGCDYRLHFSTGHKDSLALALADEVTYESAIKAILDARCTACHSPTGSEPDSDLTSWSGVSAFQEQVVARIQNNSMPPGNPLSAADKELVAAWQVGGYLEGAPDQSGEGGTPAPAPSESRHSLDLTFYRNNDPASILASQISGKSSVVVNLGLNLQEDGKAAGLTTLVFLLQEQLVSAPSQGSQPDTGAGNAGGGGGNTSNPEPTPPNNSNNVSYTSNIKVLLDASCVGCHPGMATYAGASQQGAAIVNRTADGSMPPQTPLASAQVELFKKWQALGFPEN